MLIICHDPTGALGRDTHELDPSISLQDNIARHLSSGADCRLLINGQEVDPLADARMNAPPSVADVITVLRRPRGGGGLMNLISFGLLGGAVFNSIQPKRPVSQSLKESPNNSLTAQTNVARAYEAIPDVYGYRRCWPDLIQPSTVEYIDNLKYVTEWMCISRGRGDVSDVRYAESPIADISGASYEVFGPVGGGNHPERGVTTIRDVIETFESQEVNGQEITAAVPYATIQRTAVVRAEEGASTFTITLEDRADLAQLKSLSGTATTSRLKFVVTPSEGGTPGVEFDADRALLSFSVAAGNCTLVFGSPDFVADDVSTTVKITPNATTYTNVGPFTLPLDADRIRWNTIFLRGLNGSVTIRAEWWAINEAGVEIAGTRETRDDTYTGSGFDQRYFTVTVAPLAGFRRYRVRFVRLTPANDDQGSDQAKLEELYAVRYYAEKQLPGVTVVRVTTKATTDATGFSDRKFNCRWQRHCRVFYDNVNIGPTRNFARAMAHMWTLADNDLAELDVDRLSAINAEFGETSPLLRFDGSLDDAEMSLGERMQMAADGARCQIWRDGTRWTVTREQARSYPELQLDYRNLAADGDGAISYSAHLPASNDGVELEYIDEATQAKKSYVRLTIASGAVAFGQSQNPAKIKMPACATYAQALNRAQLEARKLLYQRVTVSDKAMNDAGVLGLGSLVRWVDPADFAGDDGLQAGEVMSVSGPVISTSEPLDWKGATTGRIQFTGANGLRLGAPVACSPVAGGVQLVSVPDGIYVRGDTRQLGSRYAFAVGLTAGEMEAAGLYVCTAIRPDGKGNMDLSLAEYDARIYAAD